MSQKAKRRLCWFMAAVIVPAALVASAVALAKTTYWYGNVNYGPSANYNIQFNVSGHKVTYWFIGYGCTTKASPGDDNFPSNAPIKHGKFKLNYTMPTGRNPVSHLPYGDPGFHIIITGQFKGGKASGTMDVLNDPQLGGACNEGAKHWHAHSTGS